MKLPRLGNKTTAARYCIYHILVLYIPLIGSLIIKISGLVEIFSNEYCIIEKKDVILQPQNLS